MLNVHCDVYRQMTTGSREVNIPAMSQKSIIVGCPAWDQIQKGIDQFLVWELTDFTLHELEWELKLNDICDTNRILACYAINLCV